MGSDVKQVGLKLTLHRVLPWEAYIISQRYYDEHEKLKAKQEAEREKTSEDSMETGSEKYTCLKSLIATAPGFSTVEKPAPSLPTTPVVTMENPVMATAMGVEVRNNPACEVTKKNIPVTGRVTLENSVSKRSTPIIDHCTDKVRITSFSLSCRNY